MLIKYLDKKTYQNIIPNGDFDCQVLSSQVSLSIKKQATTSTTQTIWHWRRTRISM